MRNYKIFETKFSIEGFSVITVIEFLMLVIELMTVCCCPSRERNIKEMPNKMDNVAKKQKRRKSFLKRNSHDTNNDCQGVLVNNKVIKDGDYCNCH